MYTFIHTILILFAVLNTPNSTDNCNTQNFINSAVRDLTPGYNFLKSYSIDAENDLEIVEYSYVFVKGTQYIIQLTEANQSPGIIMTLYDSNRNKVATNQIGNQIIQSVAFPCNATSIYYIQYSFSKNAVRCGGSVLGFKR